MILFLARSEPEGIPGLEPRTSCPKMTQVVTLRTNSGRMRREVGVRAALDGDNSFDHIENTRLGGTSALSDNIWMWLAKCQAIP